MSLTFLSKRHKLGSNLTPVTKESFAKWKRTRMDKKEAEMEAIKKTKDAQAAAGKNIGMSGRDLVSVILSRIHGDLISFVVLLQSGMVRSRGRRGGRGGECGGCS